MVHNPEEQPEEPTSRERLARTIIAGHSQGAVRRIILYVILGATTMAGVAVDGAAGLLLAIAGMISLLLLAMTDELA